MAVLEDGPGTTSEIAASLGRSPKSVGSALSALFERDLISKRSFQLYHTDSNSFMGTSMWAMKSYAPIPMEKARPLSRLARLLLAGKHNRWSSFSGNNDYSLGNTEGRI